jgi:signal transduction histidine kinase
MVNERLLQAIDWFVPAELRTDTAAFWQARIFAISHLLSPCFAAVIIVFLYRADPHPGFPFWTVCALSSFFFLLPFGLKLTGRLTWVAVFSVADLTFLSIFGSFYYGGVSSPFLPWFLTALLLGFFYLGNRPLVVLGLFAVNLLGLGIAHEINGGFPELVSLHDLSNVGVISVCAATIYTSMMAVYYANVVTAQSALRREAARHLVTAAKMRRAKEEAERASEAKSVFLAKMNHQLRTPLNAVIGYSEILMEDAELDGDEAQIADLSRINSAGRHLLSLVAEVLDVAKISSDDVQLSIQEFDVAKFIGDVASTCRSLVTINRNEFLVEIADGLGTIACDETRLRQVVINLLSNAGKFTSNGKVTLRVIREQRRDSETERLLISVKDTGIGISAANLKKLFSDFAQAEASTSKDYGGTGLGLALSRHLCQLMQGDISVKSEIGRGSTFTVDIPVRTCPVDLPTLEPSSIRAAA